MERKTRSYEGRGIVVDYEVKRCIHAAECVHGLPDVFDPKARPWIQPENASAEAIAEVVAQCPTGALSCRRTDGAPGEAPPEENTLSIVPDGPLYLSGDLRLHLPEGGVAEERRVALCRCGDSGNKPFCDNTHVDREFSDRGVAVEHRLRDADEDAAPHLTVKLAPNGPILVDGPLRVVDANGTSAGGGKAAFCRCGASQSKPYCDGSHKASGFAAE